MILIETDVSGEWDRSIDWRRLAEEAVRAAIGTSRHAKLVAADTEVSVKFTTDEEVRTLNAQWRGKDKATNVLSFPMFDDPETAPMLGDVVLAAGVCASEAEEKGMAVVTHAAHLVVHGTLHLLGYDHETSDADAEEMEEAERRALAAMGIADPYEVTEVQS